MKLYNKKNLDNGYDKLLHIFFQKSTHHSFLLSQKIQKKALENTRSLVDEGTSSRENTKFTEITNNSQISLGLIG
jgi:hypothetical protein